MKTILQIALVTALCFLPFPAAAEDASSQDVSALAACLMDKADMSCGFCTILTCDDGNLPLELARRGDFFVHVLDTRNSAVEAARETLHDSGLFGKSIVVEKGSLGELCYPDNTIDLIITTHLAPQNLDEYSLPEILRVLRPEGEAILGCLNKSEPSKRELSTRELKRWLKEAGVEDAAISKDDFGVWAQITKPPLEGVDDWSHWEHGPDNNPISTDTVIQAPYMTQWLGLPYYIAMPAITTSAGGRLFFAMGHIAHHKREEECLNSLTARNAYNGTLLWRRSLPDGYLAHRSAFIATDDTFYMIDPSGSGCLLLDPKTGEEKHRIRTAEIPGEWKWIALQDGVLFALAGEQKDPPETTVVRCPETHWSWGELSKGYYAERVPWGFGNTILAYDAKRGKTLWSHTEDAPIDSRAMVIGDGQVFFYAPDSRVGCLDAKRGDLVWANTDPKIRELIEEPGRGLASTPGFRTCCFCLYTPHALYYQGQTRMNMVAISKEDGHLLWHRRKTTNNPNVIFADDRIIVGIGPGGSTLALDPMTGETIEDLKFAKVSCARLTGTPDSFFCRGTPDGTTRYDRHSGKVFYNGAFRPPCNDGVIAANGLLFNTPWACDCGLSLMGQVTMCSARDFNFEREAKESERLEVGYGDISRVEPFETSADDWSTYRGNNSRSASTQVGIPEETFKLWEFQPQNPNRPTAPTAANGLIFLCGDDGIVRAVDGASGTLKWEFLTAGPIMQPPSIWNGRAYVGSGDGYIYALEAATGRLLWRFRAAPVERRIMVYGSLCSTWPVNSGVLVEDGIAYAAAGIIDYDGTYVYAIDAITGRLLWQNVTSGHLNKDIRKGVSAQGVLTIAGGRLWMAGGNVVSPAAYDLKTGDYVGDPLSGTGGVRTNRGEEIGVFQDKYIVLGGKLRYSAGKNVVDPARFNTIEIVPGRGTGRSMALNKSRIPAAWNGERMAYVDGIMTKPVCYLAGEMDEYLKTGRADTRPVPLWEAQAFEGIDTISIAAAPNAILAVGESPMSRKLKVASTVCALNPQDGSTFWRHKIPSASIPGGFLVDRDGRVVVVMEDGSIICYAGERAFTEYIKTINTLANTGIEGRQKAVGLLNEAMKMAKTRESRDLVIANLESLDTQPGLAANKAGCITNWRVIGPFPWSPGVERSFVDEPEVAMDESHTIRGVTYKWNHAFTVHPEGLLDLIGTVAGGEELMYAVAYAYAEVEFPVSRGLLLKIGSDDGFKCWFNGELVGRSDRGRRYTPDQNVMKVDGKKGVNKILLRITQMGSAWGFGVRLTDLNGKPIDLTELNGESLSASLGEV
ncbi:MAG: PQQ-binding-like beta-propeller repeat protein [bacterium]